MISDTISRDLTRAFIEAAKTIEDKNLRESRQRITAVTLVNRQSGLCSLSEQNAPKAGWRVIKKEDLAFLLQEQKCLDYQDVIKRVAMAMACIPRLLALDCPLTYSALAPSVETFWKMGHNNAKLNDARVVLVLAAQNHPELEMSEEMVIFYIEDQPKRYHQNEVDIRGFIDDVHNAMVTLATKRKKLEAMSMDRVGALSDRDLLLKLYFFNINEDLQVREHNPALQGLAHHLNKEITLVPDSIRKELENRISRPVFVAEAEETLTPLPHGAYFLEIVHDSYAAHKLAKLGLE